MTKSVNREVSRIGLSAYWAKVSHFLAMRCKACVSCNILVFRHPSLPKFQKPDWMSSRKYESVIVQIIETFRPFSRTRDVIISLQK